MDPATKLYDLLAGAFKNVVRFVENIPVIRVAYTLALLALIFVAGRELISVWTRGRLSLSEFSYFVDGKKNSGTRRAAPR